MPTVSHARLVEIAGRWLKRTKKCGIVATELVTTARETPDAIGWRVGGLQSILVECKTSASDFARDKFKGVECAARAGLEKYYLTPPGLIEEQNQLPPGWGLLETDGSDMVLMRFPAETVTRNRRNEIAMLYSIIMRLTGKSPATRKATIEISEDATPTPAPSVAHAPSAGNAPAPTRPAKPRDDDADALTEGGDDTD